LKINLEDTDMNNINISSIIEKKFHEEAGGKLSVTIPLKKGTGRIFMKLAKDGVTVSNLANQPFLPWTVFEETLALIQKGSGKAMKGDAINGKLGDSKLPIDSIEGLIAYKIYEKKLGDTVFRRITPIGCILEWAGICDNERGELILRNSIEK
jgi:hypothetical protein